MLTPQYWKDLIQCVRNVQEASHIAYNYIEVSRIYSFKAQFCRSCPLLGMHGKLSIFSCQGGQRPLMVALSEGHGNVVEVLLKKGANHSQPDMVGAMTPLP